MGFRVCMAMGLLLCSVGANASVFDPGRSWSPGQVLNVLFLDGKENYHHRVEQEVHELTRYANIQFRFFSKRDPNIVYHIRVTFKGRTNAAAVGTDSIVISDKEPSLWLPIFKGGRHMPRSKKGTILHEFMHVLSFRHEHQSRYFPYKFKPGYIERACVKPILQGQRRHGQMSRAQAKKRCDADYNPLGPDLIYSEYDSKSIMHYSFDKGSFKGSRRKFPERMRLSRQDIRSLTEMYPW